MLNTNFQRRCQGATKKRTRNKQQVFLISYCQSLAVVIILVNCDYFLREWTILNLQLTIVNREDYIRRVSVSQYTLNR